MKFWALGLGLCSQIHSVAFYRSLEGRVAESHIGGLTPLETLYEKDDILFLQIVLHYLECPLCVCLCGCVSVCSCTFKVYLSINFMMSCRYVMYLSLCGFCLLSSVCYWRVSFVESSLHLSHFIYRMELVLKFNFPKCTVRDHSYAETAF